MLVLCIDKIKHKCYDVYTMEATTHHEHTEVQNEKEQLDVRAFYDLESIDALREAQQYAFDHSYRAAIEAGEAPVNAKLAGHNAIEQTITEYLDAYGATGQERTALDLDLSKVSINQVSPDEWGVQQEDGTKYHGGIKILSELYEDRTGRPYAELDAALDAVENGAPAIVIEGETSQQEGQVEEGSEDESPESDAEDPEKSKTDSAIESMKNHLTSLRGDLAKLAAKRQSRLFTLQHGGLQTEYDALQEEYTEQLQKLGKLELAETLKNEELSLTEKNAEVISFLFAEQAKLREESREILKGTKVSKVIDWLNRGGKTARFMKGAAVGVAAAGVGATLGAAAGVAGIAALGVGGAAAIGGAARFARGFAAKDAREGRGIRNLDENAEAALGKKLEAEATEEQGVSFDRAQELLALQLEKDIDAEQSKRRRSAAVGATAIAAGALIGATASGFIADKVTDAIDAVKTHAPDVIDATKEKASELFGGTAGAAPQPELTGETDGTGGSGDLTEQPFTSESAQAITESYENEVGASTPELVFDPAFDVAPGQGGVALFQGMGLTEADWYSVHTELLQNFPDEFYSEYGDTRIAQPGQLSLEAQEFIKTRFGL